jgi:hypothetical protein
MPQKKLLCILCAACVTLLPLAAEEHRTAVGIDLLPFTIFSFNTSIGIEATAEFSLSELFALKGGLCFMNLELSSQDSVVEDYYDYDDFYPNYLLTKLHLEGRVYPFKTTLRSAFAGVGYAFAFAYTEQAARNEGSETLFWHSLYSNIGYKFMFRPAADVSFYIEPSLFFSFSFNPGARSSTRRDLTRSLRLHGESLMLALGVAF